MAVIAVLLISVPPLCLALLIIDWILARFLKTPLIYEFDEYQYEKWDELSTAWRKVALSKGLQEITLNAKANNPRINAGISNVIDSKSMSAGGKLPWFLKTNVKPVVLTLQKSKMAILPDGIMFFDKKIGALDYKDISFNLSAVGFLVTGKRPNDSELIRYAWGYSNNDGTRDKRYKNNKQFPIMKYGKFIITSNSGLNIQFLCSNENAADNLSQVMKKYKML